jgi:hypothetical protein
MRQEINLEDIYHARMEHYGRVESRDLCEDCALLTESFMTIAYIPGISLTQYDLLLFHLRKNQAEKTTREKIKELVEELRNQGGTVPEIAEETGLCNKCVLKIVNE